MIPLQEKMKIAERYSNYVINGLLRSSMPHIYHTDAHYISTHIWAYINVKAKLV